ncbi:MAG TPA: isoaspartyl peptidase/L-asparaginase [Burkholderiaceae bacterium]|nr:isoaspartyl peptidase/L-asparaginase [Burkholderiaceae bacterium]
MVEPVLVIHGGAGALTRSVMSNDAEREYRAALTGILEAASAALNQGGSALDCVTQAVCLLEDCALFNAGKGAVFTSAGTHELDAAIMDGATLESGAIANVEHVKHPILAARAVMEHSSHVFFVSRGAEDFALGQGLEMVENDYFSTPHRREQWLRVVNEMPGQAVLDHDAARAEAAAHAPLDPDRKFGTVGAVAVDAQGNLAAATSTGGVTNKQVGRVGDSPLIGAGCYAANGTAAVSATGTGEMFIRAVAAHTVAAMMEFGGATLEQATDSVVHERLAAIKGQGGLIAVDGQGNVAMPFNTEGMYRGYARRGEKPFVAIYR